MQIKSEHLIHMKANSERLICRRRSLNVLSAVLENVMQMKSEHSDPYEGEVGMLDMKKTKSDCMN